MLLKYFKGNNPYTLLVTNLSVIALVLLSPWMVTYSIPNLLLAFVAYFCMICLGVSITFHRALTHKALKLHPWLETLFSTFGSLSGTGSPIMWVMTHRQHHRYSDKDGDPHPPVNIWKTFLGYYPRVSSYGIRDIARNKYYIFLHRYYFLILLAFGLTLGLLFGYSIAFFGFILPVFAGFSASNILNWYGHTTSVTGYRRYKLGDNSQNNIPCGLLIFGEGWHNNHHRHPGSARFGLGKFEIDMSFMIIQGLAKLGLIKNVKVATL